MSRKRKALTLLGIVFILVGLSLIGYRLMYINESRGIKDTGQDIIDDFEKDVQKDNTVNSDTTGNSDNTDSSDFSKEDNLVDKLRDAFNNKDVIGYLYYPIADISYPIVQCSDNTTYLTTNVYGKYSINGSIFLDHLNDRDFSDSASILYGHNMRDGSMFGNLERNCAKGNFFYIYTRTSKMQYMVVSKEVISPDSRGSLLSTGSSELNSFKEGLTSLSSNYISSDEDVNFVTLVTCHYTGKDTVRFGATGSLVSSESYEGE